MHVEVSLGEAVAAAVAWVLVRVAQAYFGSRKQEAAAAGTEFEGCVSGDGHRQDEELYCEAPDEAPRAIGFK